MGDKSAQTAARFHVPTQGIGLQYQLYRLGFRVLLLDEYRTSSSCPDCQGNTTRTNIKRVNPRPWERQLRAETFVHGLLECQSTQCKLECHGQWKKWNRDLMAVLSGTGLHRLQLHLLYFIFLKLQAKEKAMESCDVKTVPTLMQPYEIVYFSKAPNTLQRSNSSQ